MCDMVDDFLSYSPDSLRLDSDTDDAINSFLLEAAAAVANPSSASSESGLEASIEMIHEDDDSNGTNFSFVESVGSVDDKDQVDFRHLSNTRQKIMKSCDCKSFAETSNICCQNLQSQKSKQKRKTGVAWKQVVVTIDDDNNIIEDEDTDQEEEEG